MKNVNTSMSQRKVDFDSVGSVGARLVYQEVAQPGSQPKSNIGIFEPDQGVRKGLELVPVSHSRPQADTWPACEGHVAFPRGPVGRLEVDLTTVAGVEGCCPHPRAPTKPVKVPPTSDEGEEGRAATWFWNLLQTAGYEVW